MPLPVVPQWHVKDRGHSVKNAGGRLHLNTHTPLTHRSRSGLTMPLCRQSVGKLSGNDLTRNSSGNTRTQSSQPAEPLWTNSGVKSGISVRKLISTLKKKKKAQAGNKLSNILAKSSHARKKTPSPVVIRRRPHSVGWTQSWILRRTKLEGCHAAIVTATP